MKSVFAVLCALCVLVSLVSGEERSSSSSSLTPRVEMPSSSGPRLEGPYNIYEYSAVAKHADVGSKDVVSSPVPSSNIPILGQCIRDSKAVVSESVLFGCPRFSETMLGWTVNGDAAVQEATMYIHLFNKSSTCQGEAKYYPSQNYTSPTEVGKAETHVMNVVDATGSDMGYGLECTVTLIYTPPKPVPANVYGVIGRGALWTNTSSHNWTMITIGTLANCLTTSENKYSARFFCGSAPEDVYGLNSNKTIPALVQTYTDTKCLVPLRTYNYQGRTPISDDKDQITSIEHTVEVQLNEPGFEIECIYHLDGTTYEPNMYPWNKSFPDDCGDHCEPEDETSGPSKTLVIVAMIVGIIILLCACALYFALAGGSKTAPAQTGFRAGGSSDYVAAP